MLKEIKDTSAIKNVIKAKNELLNDTDNIKTIIDCPYLEEKCSDIECPCPKYTAYKIMEEPGIVERKILELGIDLNQDSWNIIMSMQKIFAGRFHNTSNITKEEKDKWIKEYLVCIEDEIMELMDYVNLPLDIEPIKKANDLEMKKEVIDILHFVMDVFIAGDVSPNEVKRAYLENYSTGVSDVSDLLKFAYDQESLLFFSDKETKAREGFNYNNLDKDNMILDAVMKILFANRNIRQQISWKHWKKANNEINYEKLLEAYGELFHAFMYLVIFIFDDVEELKKIYINKNVENIIRQEVNYGPK